MTITLQDELVHLQNTDPLCAVYQELGRLPVGLVAITRLPKALQFARGEHVTKSDVPIEQRGKDERLATVHLIAFARHLEMLGHGL